MSNSQVVTCQIRYTLNLSQLSAFESYARTWMMLIERCGGTHHGYFLPRAAPDGAEISFPGLGRDGPQDVAVAMFTFPDEESYRRYRQMVKTAPECQICFGPRARNSLLHPLRAAVPYAGGENQRLNS